MTCGDRQRARRRRDPRLARLRLLDLRALARPAAPPRAGVDGLAAACSPLGSAALWAGAAARLGGLELPDLLPVRRHPQRAVPRPRHRLPAGRPPARRPGRRVVAVPRRRVRGRRRGRGAARRCRSTPTSFPRAASSSGVLPRIFAGVGSGLAAIVIIAGAVWSAIAAAAASAGRRSAGRLAVANVLIARRHARSSAARRCFELVRRRGDWRSPSPWPSASPSCSSASC